MQPRRRGDREARPAPCRSRQPRTTATDRDHAARPASRRAPATRKPRRDAIRGRPNVPDCRLRHVHQVMLEPERCRHCNGPISAADSPVRAICPATGAKSQHRAAHAKSQISAFYGLSCDSPRIRAPAVLPRFHLSPSAAARAADLRRAVPRLAETSGDAAPYLDALAKRGRWNAHRGDRNGNCRQRRGLGVVEALSGHGLRARTAPRRPQPHRHDRL